MKREMMSLVACVLTAGGVLAGCGSHSSDGGNFVSRSIERFGVGREIVCSSTLESRELDVRAFDGLELSGSIQCRYMPGPGPVRVVVTAPDNLMPHLRYDIDKDRDLEVWSDCGYSCRDDSQRPLLTITGGCIEKFDLSGASNVLVEGTFEVGSLDIDVSGASAFKAGAVRAVKVKADASGASSVHLAGIATEVDLEASGASSVEAVSMQAERGKAEASGASSVECCVKYLRQETSGVASVRNH